MRIQSKRNTGFTIVELLIVIVVIGILAAITIVAFNGISGRAKIAAIQSELGQAARQLSADNALSSVYPASAGQANNGAGLKAGSNTTLQYTYNALDNTYCLQATNGTITYIVTSANTTPTVGTCVSTPVNAGGVTTLAGSTAGYLDSTTGTSARFDHPGPVALDSTGNLFVGDTNNNRVRKITPAGVVTTFAGSGVAGSTNGTGTAAQFNGPDTILIDSSNNLLVVDYNSQEETGLDDLRKVTPAGVVTTAGKTGVPYPEAAVYDSAGYLYIAYDYGAPSIRKRTTLLAPFSWVLYAGGGRGFVEGMPGTAKMNFPSAMAFDASGNLYITDTDNNRIRKVTPDGNMSTFAGSGVAGSANGTGTAAQFNGPSGLAFDSAGNLFVTEVTARLIRKITPAGVVTTFAGSGTNGTADGTTTAAQFSAPSGITIGPDGVMYISDGNRIRKIQ